MRWGHFLQTAFTSLARWFVKTNTLPIFSGRLHLLHTWRCPSIFNDSGNTKDGSSVIWWNPWFLPSVQVINLPLQELPALHGGFPCPCVHILTLKRFAKNVFRTWGSSQGSLSGTQTNRPGEHTAPFKSFSSSNIALFMMCFQYLKGSMGSLYLFPVWPWWGCCGFTHGSSRNGDLSARRRCRRSLFRAPSFTHEELFKQQTRPTRAGALISFKHAYFLGWYVEVMFLPLLWNNLQWGRASCAGRRFHFAKEKKEKP